MLYHDSGVSEGTTGGEVTLGVYRVLKLKNFTKSSSSC